LGIVYRLLAQTTSEEWSLKILFDMGFWQDYYAFLVLKLDHPFASLLFFLVSNFKFQTLCGE
jgi:hypothetical protein